MKIIIFLRIIFDVFPQGDVEIEQRLADRAEGAVVQMVARR
jgi:hypothetical protein